MKTHQEILINEALIYFSKTDFKLSVYQNKQLRWLCINDVVQSIMDKSEPWRLTMPHQRAIVQPLKRQSSIKSVLECGLGAGNIARYLAHHHKGIQLKSIECSQQVIELFQRYFNPASASFNIVKASALTFVDTTEEYFDWIIADMFVELNSPSPYDQKLLSLFNDKLMPKGCLTINLPNGDTEIVNRVCNELEKNFDLTPRITPVAGYQNKVIHAYKS